MKPSTWQLSQPDPHGRPPNRKSQQKKRLRGKEGQLASVDDSDGGVCGSRFQLTLPFWAGSVGTIINSAETLPKTPTYVLT